MTNNEAIILNFQEEILRPIFSIDKMSIQNNRCDLVAILVATLFIMNNPDYTGNISEISKDCFEFLFGNGYIFSKKPQLKEFNEKYDKAFNLFDKIFHEKYTELKKS